MFGLRLRFLRCRSGLTQAQLGAKLNVTASALGMYERGQRMPALSIIIAISKEFGVSCDYLLSGQGQNEREAAMELTLMLVAALDSRVGKRASNQHRQPRRQK